MVYLVDDDSEDLEIVQEALAKYNYAGPVNIATNGQMLMKELTDPKRASRPSVIVLDLNMPLKDGFEALREIKSHPSLKNIPVIILTASSNKADEIKCFELGCNFFFTKPSRLNDYGLFVTMVKRLSGQTH
jgi:two-component system, response regulator